MDGLAHGVTDIGTFTPIQLWAGEPNGGTTQGVLASGFVFGKTNDRGETYKFPVVARRADGKLVPWNPLSDSDGANSYATGTFTISSTGPVAAETVTINGDVLTFRAAVDADLPTEVAIGATINETAANLAAVINALRNDFSPNFPVTATVAGAVVTVRAPGVAGNAVTIVETATNIAVSGATLSGGTDSDAEPDNASLPIGILPHAVDTSATGLNADTESPYFFSGNPNYDALDVPAGTTYQELKAAFDRTAINIQKLG